MSRILRIELRRSAALGTALILLVAGVVLLFFAEGIWFATGWMQLAMTQRLYLAVLWPLALAAGAWQARREPRSNVAELFASTPRPRSHRSLRLPRYQLRSCGRGIADSRGAVRQLGTFHPNQQPVLHLSRGEMHQAACLVLCQVRNAGFEDLFFLVSDVPCRSLRRAVDLACHGLRFAAHHVRVCTTDDAAAVHR